MVRLLIKNLAKMRSAVTPSSEAHGVSRSTINMSSVERISSIHSDRLLQGAPREAYRLSRVAEAETIGIPSPAIERPTPDSGRHPTFTNRRRDPIAAAPPSRIGPNLRQGPGPRFGPESTNWNLAAALEHFLREARRVHVLLKSLGVVIKQDLPGGLLLPSWLWRADPKHHLAKS